jgi:hypothetical protein
LLSGPATSNGLTVGRAWFNANLELWSPRIGPPAVSGFALFAGLHGVGAQSSEVALAHRLSERRRHVLRQSRL